MRRSYQNFLRTLFFIPVLSVPALAQGSAEADFGKRVASYVKPSVVRILDGCSGTYEFVGQDGFLRDTFASISSGSGFFIHPDGYIVTNAHVVQETESGEASCKEILRQLAIADFAETAKQAAKKNNVNLSTADLNTLKQDISQSLTEEDFQRYNWVILPNGDEFRYEVKSFGTPIEEEGDLRGKDVAIIKVEIKNAPSLVLGDSDNVDQLDAVTVFGYPSVADSNTLALKSVYEVSATGGGVAATAKETEDGVRVLQIDAPVAPGSSGGPVINDQFEVIGMVTFGKVSSEQASSSFSFAIRTSTIHEFIGEAGVENEQGKVNALYRQGLDYLWKDDYRRAMLQFEEVQRLFPQHSEIERLIQDSQQLMISNSGGNSMMWLGAGVVAIVIAGVAYGLTQRKLLIGKFAGQFAGNGATADPEKTTKQASSWQPAATKFVTGVFRPNNTVVSGAAATQMSLQPYLEITNPRGGEMQLDLNRPSYRIGRDRDWSDLVIPDEGWEVLSRHHAVLIKEGADYRIYDGDRVTPSTNGIWINHVAIDTQTGHSLKHGDQLKIGKDPTTQVTMRYYNPANP
jgi:S1-C subfamily serine protease